MKPIIKRTSLVLLIFLILWLLLGFVLLSWDKADIHLFINQYQSPFFNVFFRIITFLGDGIMPVVLALFFAIISYRKALIIASTGLLAGLLAQIFKRFVFADSPRPKAFFDGIADLHFIPGVDVFSHHSFPSGHAATVFALFFALSFLTSKKYLQFTYLALALLTGFSRIYLSQHFLIDVYFGAITGIVTAFFLIFYLDKIKAPWLESSIMQTIRRKNEPKSV